MISLQGLFMPPASSGVLTDNASKLLNLSLLIEKIFFNLKAVNKNSYISNLLFSQDRGS